MDAKFGGTNTNEGFFHFAKCTSWHEKVRQASERKEQQHNAASTCDNPRRQALALLHSSDSCTPAGLCPSVGALGLFGLSG